MTSETQALVTASKHKWLQRLLIVLIITTVILFVCVRARPLVFNESFFGHAHCIAQAGGSLLQYASEHQSNFPTHTNGYGDALLLVVKEYLPEGPCLTGPGYDSDVFKKALASNGNVDEATCGRVYIQGLTTSSDPEIAILFDKLPTPGGDHCHGLARLTAPLCREVLFVDGSHRMIQESEWLEFSQKQIELLVKAGFDRAAAESLYGEKRKVR